jgi:hypothetical protein
VFSSGAAGASRVSHGEANAVFQAFGNGGWAVLLHNDKAHGAPSNGLPGLVTIRPFSGTPFDGAHYCALDWHAIVIADIEPGPHQDAAATIADLTVAFTLDGAPLQTTQTAVKRFLNPERFGLEDAYYSQFGRVMAPSELAAGSHSLSVEIRGADGSVGFADAITFVVDAPGTGACL